MIAGPKTDTVRAEQVCSGYAGCWAAAMGPVLSEDERDTDIHPVGGLVFTLAGRVPAKGDMESHPSGIEFRILDSDPRRIRRLRVRRAAVEVPGQVAGE